MSERSACVPEPANCRPPLAVAAGAECRGDAGAELAMPSSTEATWHGTRTLTPLANQSPTHNQDPCHVSMIVKGSAHIRIVQTA